LLRAADEVGHAAEPLKRGDMGLQERLLGLGLERGHERRAREARAHQEQMYLDEFAAQQHLRLPPVDLGLDPRSVAGGTNTSSTSPSSRRRSRT
jgi:hypothetical protein